MRTPKIAAAALILGLAISPAAQAQDSWTGLYAGGAVGNLDVKPEIGQSESEAIASIIAGYNMDLGNMFVIGLEGDLNSDTLSKNDFSYSLRPRAGYKLLNEAGMAYGTFGYAGTQVRGENPEGWIIGIGYEHQLTGMWHLRAEYLYSEQDLQGLDSEVEFLRAGLTTKF
ncbi:MAG: porin family protein [Aestuariivirgaceae bacterium]|nr:porin family protein [Aestuariivirgaceae bacterium]